MKTTWKADEEHGKLSSVDRKELPDSVYAFPKKRKEPLVDASHVREAIARFDQVKDVTDEERDQAFANIQAAAKHYKHQNRGENLARTRKEAAHFQCSPQILTVASAAKHHIGSTVRRN